MCVWGGGGGGGGGGVEWVAIPFTASFEQCSIILLEMSTIIITQPLPLVYNR